VRDSLPEPNAFRLKYRSEIADVVRHAVREKIRPTGAALQQGDKQNCMGGVAPRLGRSVRHQEAQFARFLNRQDSRRGGAREPSCLVVLVRFQEMTHRVYGYGS
jgi:hypothetical protein